MHLAAHRADRQRGRCDPRQQSAHRAAGIDLSDHEGQTTHAVGGRVAVARYKTVGLRLHPRDADEQRYVEWQAQVGFIEGWHSDGLVLLGNVGFLDRFTVTMSRFTQAIAVEERTAFDERYGTVLSD